jgi:hypothetical protein
VQPVEEIVPDKFLDYAVRNFDAFKQLKCTVYMYEQAVLSIDIRGLRFGCTYYPFKYGFRILVLAVLPMPC